MLPSAVLCCSFCDSSLAGASLLAKEHRTAPSQSSLAHSPDFQQVPHSYLSNTALAADSQAVELAWRQELAHKLESYRGRRRKASPSAAQAQFSFAGESEQSVVATQNSLSDSNRQENQDFSFTIAIGRSAKHLPAEKPHMVIDLSAESEEVQSAGVAPEQPEFESHSGIYPTALIDDRRLAAVLDAIFLMFAYGAFLSLFGSLGGQFTFSKISTAVYVASFAIIYTQYFALFTFFGGTTPGMMLRSLQVVNYSGDQPSPTQLALRSLGYLISAATFGLGYLWSLWDEDGLTWHDRLSETYLAPQQEVATGERPAPLHLH